MQDFKMSSQEMMRTNIQTQAINKKIGVNKAGEKSLLGKDSFLKLLVTELQHQDPTKPMEDREFISQMAQFSSLEQMSNLNKEVKNLISSSSSSEAYSLLGKNVEAFNSITGKPVAGKISSIQHNGNGLSLFIGNQEISMENIKTVYHSENKIKN